jgi:hypothetical protein
MLRNMVLSVFYIVLLTIHVSAQPSPDGDGTMVDLVRQAYERINDPEHINRNTDATIFMLKQPLNGNYRVYVSSRVYETTRSYRIVRYDEQEICFSENAPEEVLVICRPLTDIASISYWDHSYDFSQFEDQKSRDVNDIGGLIYQMRDNSEEEENLLVEFLAPFDGSEKITGFLLGTGRPQAFDYATGNMSIQSYWDEYLCIWFIIHVSPGAAAEQYYCSPYHNIASVQVIYDTNLAGGWGDRIVIADLLVEREPDLEIPIDMDVEATKVQLETWLETETDQLLEVSLIIPILLLDKPFSSLSLGQEANEEAPFYLTEIGLDYFCFSEDREVRSPDIRSGCITFYNVAEIQEVSGGVIE